MIMLQAKDVFWLAGILEGEGCFQIRKSGGVSIELCMTDKDVVERFRSVCGVGTMGKPRLLKSGKTAYQWSVTNQADAVGLMMTLLPVMGERRSKKIRECLEYWNARPLRASLKEFCKSGHPLSGDNMNIVKNGAYLKRNCKECARIRQQKYRAAADASVLT